MISMKAHQKGWVVAFVAIIIAPVAPAEHSVNDSSPYVGLTEPVSNLPLHDSRGPKWKAGGGDSAGLPFSFFQQCSRYRGERCNREQRHLRAMLPRRGTLSIAEKKLTSHLFLLYS